MANSLLTGFSGLASHQKMIEVVGNNLANLNTTGFKARRASFSDVFYETIRGASGSTDATTTSGGLGGANPAQIGHGSKLSSVAVNFSQGLLEATGAKYDLAIEGNGFFVVNSENGQNYTRDGTFGIDQAGYLVDVATGNRVQRFGTVGEVATDGPAFQTPGTQNIQIPLGATVPGFPSTTVDLSGNVSPTHAPITNQRVSTVDPLTTGGLTPVPAVPADLLNSLDFVTTDYVVGDEIQVDGVQHDGVAFSATIDVSDTSTLQDLLDGINAELTGATAQIGADGKLFVEADTGGVSSLQVTLADAPSNVGAADFVSNTLETVVEGQDGEVFVDAIEIFDAQGTPQSIGIAMLQQSDGTWTLTASLDPLKGTITDGTIEGIEFNPDGSFKTAGTTGDGDANLIFHFAGETSSQTISVNFGAPGSLTSVAGTSDVSGAPDGLSKGTLFDTKIDQTGMVEGIASNGRSFPLAQLAVALFRNPHGLTSEGDNLFRASTNSGSVELGSARTSGRGSVMAGELERSNVDIAVEFTRLIIAQRGFSANARTITVADELQQELTSLIR